MSLWNTDFGSSHSIWNVKIAVCSTFWSRRHTNIASITLVSEFLSNQWSDVHQLLKQVQSWGGYMGQEAQWQIFLIDGSMAVKAPIWFNVLWTGYGASWYLHVSLALFWILELKLAQNSSMTLSNVITNRCGSYKAVNSWP